MATHSSTLAWRIPWREKPGRLQSMGLERVGYDWATSLSNYGGGNGNVLQRIPCMYCYTYCPQSCRRPPPTHASTGDSWASLGQSLVGSLPLSPGSWCTQGSVCALQVSISQSYVSSGSYMVWLMATSSKRVVPYPHLLHPESLSLWQSTGDLYLHRRHRKTILSQTLWDPCVLVHTRFVWALWASLVGMGFDSKCNFAPPTILLGLALWPVYRFLKRQVRCSGIPISLRIFHSLLWSTPSKALA